MIFRMLSQHQPPPSTAMGPSGDPIGPTKAIMMGKLTGETGRTCVCCLTCQAGINVHQLQGACVCMNTSGCHSHNSQSGCHSIPPQNFSSSCWCVLSLLFLTIGCQTFRIICPLAATATQFIQHTSNAEAGLACSLDYTKPRTHSSQ